MIESTPPSYERGVSPARRSQANEPAPSDDLVERVSSLIDQARQSIASYANATLTMTYWQIEPPRSFRRLGLMAQPVGLSSFLAA